MSAERAARAVRALLTALVGLCAAPLFAAAGLQPLEVAAGVYAFLGDATEVRPANAGHVANSGFIVGGDGVVVIDSGSTREHGAAMLTAIREVTALPVRLVILTHAAPEFIFGAAAFQDAGIAVLAHRETAALMRSRCETCRANLIRLLGEARMRGARVVVPDRLVAASGRIDVGGRGLELLHFGWASSPGDLAVFDPTSGVLFAGGLVSIERIPDLRDAELGGWLDALRDIAALPVKKLVPGFGPIASADASGATRRYLQALDEAVRRIYDEGLGLLEAPSAAALPAFAGWRQYPEIHRRNVHHRYLQLEQAEFR